MSPTSDSGTDVGVTGALRDLRRLLYCGEWIESHALHIYLLHAPDFLGYAGGIDMARDHPEAVGQRAGFRQVAEGAREERGPRVVRVRAEGRLGDGRVLVALAEKRGAAPGPETSRPSSLTCTNLAFSSPDSFSNSLVHRSYCSPILCHQPLAPVSLTLD